MVGKTERERGREREKQAINKSLGTGWILVSWKEANNTENMLINKACVK